MYKRMVKLLSEVVTSQTLGQERNTLPLVKSGRYKGQMYKSPRGNPDLPDPKPTDPRIQGPSAPESVLQAGRDRKRSTR